MPTVRNLPESEVVDSGTNVKLFANVSFPDVKILSVRLGTLEVTYILRVR